ncbi:MAG: hypothetical protein KQI78_13770 [Deltaproteobacteria bacterium]|nr:hypothetical protein [Deltaproteobacteria bacterium]
MSIGIKVYHTKDFIRKTAQGKIDLERSLEAVCELAVAANYFKGHSILMDLRDTEVDGDRSDALRVAAEFATHFKSFHNKIALIIPDTAERMAKAEFMRTCMHLQGFQWEFFMAYEDAIDWLSDITEL